MLQMAAVCVLGALWAGDPPGIPANDGFSPRFPYETRGQEVATPLPEPKANEPTPVVPLGTPNPCEGVPPEAQMSCPLTGQVVAIEPVSQGVRLLVRRGLSPNQLRDQLVCQVNQARIDADTPPACTFLGPDMNVVVRSQGKSTTAVELLTSPPDQAKASLLLERLETAFPRARKPRR